MTMRKYIVIIHEDGRVVCAEYEDPEEVFAEERKDAFKTGYTAAMYEFRKKALEFRKRRENSREDNLIYAAVACVCDEVSARMASYLS